jgi:hypothetical protein
MPATSPDNISTLRRRVAALRGRLPKARLREFPEGVPPDGRDETGREYLTIHQAAARLNTTAESAVSLLARVETRLDLNGVSVVEAGRFEQLLLDLADGRDPSRFL